MMKQGGKVLLFCLVTCVMVSYAYQDADVKFHQTKILESLQEVRKQHPNVESSVYRALDHVGTLCKLCRTYGAQKQTLENQLKEQQEENHKLKQGNDHLSNELKNMRAKLSTSEQQLSYQVQSLERTRQEKNELVSRAADVERERQTIHQKIRALEEMEHQQGEKQQSERLGTDFLNTSTSDPAVGG